MEPHNMFKVVPTRRAVKVYRVCHDLTPDEEVEAFRVLVARMETHGCKVQLDFSDALKQGHKGQDFINHATVITYRQAWWTHGDFRESGVYNDGDLLTSTYHALMYCHQEPDPPTVRSMVA